MIQSVVNPLFLMLISWFVQPAHEKIGVVDSQWIVHQVIPSLGNQVSQLKLQGTYAVNRIQINSLSITFS